LHVDMNEGAMHRVATLVKETSYDICVLTGDYRGEAFGPFQTTLAGVARIRSAIKGSVYGVLGNHDTIRLLPGLERLGIRMLVNESEAIHVPSASSWAAGATARRHHRNPAEAWRRWRGREGADQAQASVSTCTLRSRE